MKKLKDLKESEYIRCETHKDAKWVIKNINNTWFENELLKGIVHKFLGQFYLLINPSEEQFNASIPASEFMNSKTSKRLKQLEKKVDYLSDFVANMQPKTESIHQQLSREEALKHPNCIAKVNESGTGLVFDPAGNPESKELEVGKWYKRPHCKALFCVVGNPKEEPFEVYGFDDEGEWMIKLPIQTFPVQTFKDGEVEAFKEEVEGALIIEAERRGFKQGVKVNRGMFPDIINDTVILQSNNNKYIINEDSLEIGFYTIYNKGIWAEIIEQPKEIDWNVPGQLFSNKNGKIVLLSDGKHDKNTFNGTLIKGDIGGVGMYINKAYKNCYVKFNGSIILKND